MTDYTTADAVAAAFADARPIFAGAFHADDYAIVRTIETPDGSGGSTSGFVTVEMGRCSLTVSQRMGGEGISGGRVTPASLYTAELPIDSVVTENDTLGFSGRTFNVTDAKRGGNLDLFVVAELEER